MIKNNSQSETRKDVDETSGLAVDTTKDTDINQKPAPVPTGNGEGRQTKHTAAITAEKAQKSIDK